MPKLSENDAWKAMHSFAPEKALEIWNELIASCKDEQQRDDLRSNSCYALLGLDRIEEARDIYLELYRKSQSHIYLHQLAMVEREAGNYPEAIKYLDLEA